MSYFQTLKDSITCRDAAEKYGLEVSRSGMARCPLHDDHTPSLKVDERYYCFGCHPELKPIMKEPRKNMPATRILKRS